MVRKASKAVIAVLTALALSACTNIKGSLTLNLASSTGTSTTATLLTIGSVVRDTSDPTGTFDIVGDNTGWMGTYCIATDGSGSTSGASNCQCIYDFVVTTTTSGSTKSVNNSLTVDTTYHEANLVKCLHDSRIPASVQTVNVSIVVNAVPTTGGPYLKPPIYSNSIAFSMYGAGTPLDTTNPLNFSKVRRYTCRDVVSVPNVFETGSSPQTSIYDPFQSESTTISYPLNFYTTNMGDTMNRYVLNESNSSGSSVGGWDCPTNPDNPGSAYQVTLYSSTAWAPSGGTASKVIDSPTATGTQPRSTFYLSNQSTGVFDVPVNAYIAPYLASATAATGSTSSAPPPLGYAASPISLGSAGQETCPDSSIPIPSGYHWVKVWLYRMSLPTRHYLTSASMQMVNAIACSPGTWPTAAGSPYTSVPYSYVIPDCSDPGWATFQLDNLASGYLAARGFSGTLMCMHPWAGVINQSGSSSTWPQYSDEWDVNSHQLNAYDPNYSCGGTLYKTAQSQSDPLHLCTQTNNSANATTPDLTSPVPYDANPTSENIDDPSTPRFDFVFVVTPITVMSGDMTDTTSQASFEFTPYRFRSDTECGATDPDASCASQASSALKNYGLQWTDVTSASVSSAKNIFPVCALQPN